MTRRLSVLWIAAIGVAGVVATTLAQGPPSSDEDVARRQLENGRSLARQGKYSEALNDFKAVADTHGTSSVADDALLEIARYYLDVANDVKQATDAVDNLLKKYPLSDSAPDAYIMKGRLALAHSHQLPDIETALTNFDRVANLFPSSEAVPRALQSTGEALWLAKRFDEALAALGRVEVEYSTDPAAADAYVTAGLVRVSLGDPIGAMESLQQVRNRWPNTPQANEALANITLLYRLYVRSKSGAPFVLSADSVGPAKLQSVVALARTWRGGIYYATEQEVGIIAPANAEKPPVPAKPRGLALDATGNLVVLDGGLLRTGTGGITCMMPRKNGAVETFSKLDAALELSGGDWLVMDGGENVVYRFNRAGTYMAPYSTMKLSRLAINTVDEVAGLDRDSKGVILFDAGGKAVTKIPFKGVGYDLQNAEDLTFDAFGHLYVLDRTTVAVFSPFPGPGDPVSRPITPGGVNVNYRLVAQFSEPEKSTTGFKKGTAFVVDNSGALFIYDDRAQRIMVYR